MTEVLSNVLTLSIALVAMHQRNWILATLGIILVQLFVISTKKVDKTRWNLSIEAQELLDKIKGY